MKPKFRITVVALFVVAAVVFPYLETEIDIFTFGLGGVLLVGALLIPLKWPRASLEAEGVAFLGLMILSELAWLTVVPILVYAALLLDSRLPAQQPVKKSYPYSVWLSPVLANYIVLALGAAGMVAKELFLG